MPWFDGGAINMRDLLRRLAEQVMYDWLVAVVDQPCGGGTNSRNGNREWSLATCAGALSSHIPKLRSDNFRASSIKDA